MAEATDPGQRRPGTVTAWGQPRALRVIDADAGEAFGDDPAGLIDATNAVAELAELYAAVLAQLERVAATVARADWSMTAERLGHLADAATNLQQRLGTALPASPPSAVRELAIVAAQRSRAGRALHSIDTLTDPAVRAAADVQQRRNAAFDAEFE